MDYKTKNKIRKFLESIINGDLSVLCNKRFGICLNLSEYVETDGYLGYDFIDDYSKGWKHFSGDSVFPVIREDGCDKWRKNQLILRKSLCKYLLTTLDGL
jgi:hypothetical protein